MVSLPTWPDDILLMRVVTIRGTCLGFSMIRRSLIYRGLCWGPPVFWGNHHEPMSYSRTMQHWDAAEMRKSGLKSFARRLQRSGSRVLGSKGLDGLRLSCCRVSIRSDILP